MDRGFAAAEVAVAEVPGETVDDAVNVSRYHPMVASCMVDLNDVTRSVDAVETCLGETAVL